MMERLIKQALREDIGRGDITTNALIPPEQKAKAVIVAKQSGVIAGLDVAKEIFAELDKNIKFKPLVRDGDKVAAGKKIADITGGARAVLTAERTALNFLAHLSGIATLTRQFVDAVKPYKAEILDTRKTSPGLRMLEKYAVKCGGGENHRMGLWDMMLIKENHLAVVSRQSSVDSFKKMVEKARKRTGRKIKIEIEVRSLSELKSALKAKPDVILLDNMPLEQIKEAVKIRNSFSLSTIDYRLSTELEASGRVTLKNIRRIAATGVERISIGALTHSAKALDVSLEII